jgi:hypothetical protein
MKLPRYLTKLRQKHDTKQMLRDAGIVVLLIGPGFAAWH